MTYKCPTCGHIIEEGTTLCTSCGQVFKWESSSEKPNYPNIESTQEKQNNSEIFSSAPTMKVTEQEAEKTTSNENRSAENISTEVVENETEKQLKELKEKLIRRKVNLKTFLILIAILIISIIIIGSGVPTFLEVIETIIIIAISSYIIGVIVVTYIGIRRILLNEKVSIELGEYKDHNIGINFEWGIDGNDGGNIGCTSLLFFGPFLGPYVADILNDSIPIIKPKGKAVSNLTAVTTIQNLYGDAEIKYCTLNYIFVNAVGDSIGTYSVRCIGPIEPMAQSKFIDRDISKWPSTKSILLNSAIVEYADGTTKNIPYTDFKEIKRKTSVSIYEIVSALKKIELFKI